MKNIRPYLIVAGLLAALALYFFLSRRSGTYPPSDNDFAVSDTGLIAAVRITSPQGELDLERHRGHWTADGYSVREESIRALYMLLSRLEAGAPVSRSPEKRVRRGLADHATRVNILMADKREKAYRVYFDSLTASTYMILEGSDLPFRVRVRGYRQKNLQQLYRPDAGYWRDKHIFHYPPGEIRTVALLNNREPDKSFHLAKDREGKFEVAKGTVPGSWVPATEESVEQYLGYFYDVRFESFLDPSTDTLEHSEDPDFILTVELENLEKIGVRLFPVYHREGSGGSPVPDYNLLYARLDRGEEWVVVKYVQIDPLLKDFDYFSGL
jgi:hypothetical protein